nr:calcyclin-binding protein-like [Microcebus murinus]
MPSQLKNPRSKQKSRTRCNSKSQRKAELLDNKKLTAVVASIAMGHTVKIKSLITEGSQSGKSGKIYITLTGVYQVPTKHVEVHFTDWSLDLLVKNLNGKTYYFMIINSLLKPMSLEGSSKKVKTVTVLPLFRKQAENTWWHYLTEVEKQCEEERKPSYVTEIDPSEGLMNVLKKIYEDGDDGMKQTINKAWVESKRKASQRGH